MDKLYHNLAAEVIDPAARQYFGFMLENANRVRQNHNMVRVLPLKIATG